MVSSKLLCRVDTATDVEAFAINFPKPYDKYLLAFWYRDVSYGSDSFGCTTLPNIFHWWILDKTQLTGQTGTAVPHYNLFGNECRAEVLFANAQFFMRSGLKLLTSGYVYGGNYQKFVALFDLSDPTKPTLIKELLDVSTPAGGYWNLLRALYHPPTDEIYVLSINGDVRYAKYTDFLNATDFSSLTLVGNLGFSPATGGILPFSSGKLMVNASQYGGTGVWNGLLDVSTKTLTRYTSLDAYQGHVSGRKYLLGLKISNNTLTGIDVIDKTNMSVLRSLTLNIALASQNPWIDLGDYLAQIVIDGKTFRVINLTDGSYFDIILPYPMFGSNLIAGKIYGFNWVSGINTTGELYELTLDAYYYLDYDPTTKKAVLKDQAGSPVPNKTVIISKLFAPSRDSGFEKDVTKTSDASGVIDLSDISGVFSITVVG